VIAIATESVTVAAIIILVSSDLAVASDIRSFAAVAASIQAEAAVAWIGLFFITR